MARSIFFSTPMANAILSGKKTVTRQVIPAYPAASCPYGPPGRHLWLKEDFYAYGYWSSKYSELKKRTLWHFIDMTLESGQAYQFSAPEGYARQPRMSTGPLWWYRPGRHMPRQASRIELEVTDIGSEQLQDITDEQASAEGFYPIHDSTHVYFANHMPAPYSGLSPTAVIAFATYWQSLHKRHAWHDNPWVWVIRFRRVL
ncbi:hypothetical protein ASF84_11070 [Pseudomonas sp. Leaf127]|uniref:hypothetical protein n=1 Tax=Pseudomonas sp. Leaf127 TaxID=1736267 RepID=UPI000702C45F|nr:hypothetical protein [Pseudomonas sp. Leaf127]KQQ55860.1 hypothetical protein ASF84_11070 [Pseudomonas sp. Leaf127]